MNRKNSRRDLLLGGSALMAAATLGAPGARAQQTPAPAGAAPAAATGRRQPNIVFIMADDVGWFNIRAYNRGIMNTDTPNLDRLAAEGMLFTDYYAEASCTAGRANFITGELPIRTGLTTVGQAGATVGMPAAAPTIATVLKSMGYATAQYGKNHLGDRNEFLPTLHGFDEFFGYLYHLDAMEDPFWHSFPQELRDRVGPRNLVRSFATTVDDPTEQPRWGKVGKQRIVDEGPLPPRPMPGIRYNMHTFDEVITENVKDFIDRSVEANKPFFVWMNPTRMHVITHLSPHYQGLRNGQNGWYEEEAGMKQLDDNVGAVMAHLKAKGLDDNTIVVFTTDNGAENFTWPDGGNTPFAGGKGTGLEGGFRVPCIARWPDHIPAGKVENGIISGLDWFPTFVAAAGNPNITLELRQGKDLGGTTYKVHLDGYDQTPMLTGRGPSNRNEVFYFTQTQLAAVRIGDYKYRFLDQPTGWLGGTVQLDWPMITNLRLDPFERMGMPNGANGSLNFYQFYVHEFWRFVFVQQEVGRYAQTFIDYPPMQAGASFNMEAVKQQVEQAITRARRMNQ
ncbi:sulfatase-like hydrolase/transferase [Roseomonas sp. HJA6]|uniref:Sulfatase-like hydrolase/transferase n=1 Tax=Roseomonas alba TaxID=2846776 RepID=A0ABS7AAR3_9PROT|nr:sulfatase-like hydrolase/transferase [Neoroseomonas alba]MBW6398852.1 sulfatase-like hydrolase/transferase [Neoroseomonas alba]